MLTLEQYMAGRGGAAGLWACAVSSTVSIVSRSATHKGPGRANLIQANLAMSEEGRSGDPSGVDKELMKKALHEILDEIPAFRALSKGKSKAGSGSLTVAEGGMVG